MLTLSLSPSAFAISRTSSSSRYRKPATSAKLRRYFIEICNSHKSISDQGSPELAFITRLRSANLARSIFVINASRGMAFRKQGSDVVLCTQRLNVPVPAASLSSVARQPEHKQPKDIAG